MTTTALIVILVLLILVVWLPPRLLWIRRRMIVRRLADAPGGADLLALRALTGPPAALVKLPTPPGGFAGAWRRGDQEVIAALGAAASRTLACAPDARLPRRGTADGRIHRRGDRGVRAAGSLAVRPSQVPRRRSFPRTPVHAGRDRRTASLAQRP